MNNPNPFVPKGSLLEQQSNRRSRMKLGVFCVLAVGVAGLMAMLIQGCKRETETADNTMGDTNTPAVDTNASAMDTNASAVMAPVTNLQPPVVAPPIQTSGTEYVVVKGDSLAKIAKKFGVKVKAVEDANPGVIPTKLKVGQKLSIPAGTGAGMSPATSAVDSIGAGTGGDIYIVKSGDTLTKIAKSHGTTVKAIETENNLATTHITVGQKLKVSERAATASPSLPVDNTPNPVLPTNAVGH
jgi:LysM repeat protein